MLTLLDWGGVRKTSAGLDRLRAYGTRLKLHLTLLCQAAIPRDVTASEDRRTMTNLASMSARALEEMGGREFRMALDLMTPEAIDRFRKMRKMPQRLVESLETYLAAHPEKIAGGRLPTPGRQSAHQVATARRPTKAAARKTSPPSKTGGRQSVAKGAGKAGDGYVPLADRFKAWWYGSPTPRGGRGGEDPGRVQRNEVPPEKLAGWRACILERVWGKGFIMPGGDRPILDMARLSGLEPEHSVADVTAGLGGPARALVHAYPQATIHRYNTDRELMDAARALYPDHPAQDFFLDAETPSFSGRRYDRIFARESLCLVRGRDRMLQFFAENLRGGGALVFSDAIARNPAHASEVFAEWRDNEVQKPHLLTPEEHKDLLVDSRLELTSTENLTRGYRAMVEPAFRSLIEWLKTSPLPSDGVDALMIECELWRRRLAVIDSGEIEIIRFHATRRRVRMLSQQS